MEHMFHTMKYIFHTLEYIFQTLEQNFYHRENTFIALSYNNLSTMFQKTQNKGMFNNQHDIIYGTPFRDVKPVTKSQETLKKVKVCGMLKPIVLFMVNRIQSREKEQ